MRRAPWLFLALVACQSAPTLTGGDTTPTVGHIFFTRTDLATGSSGGTSLHMTIDDDFNAVRVAPRNATPVASHDGRYLAWLTTTLPADFTSPAVIRLLVYDRWSGDTHRVLTDSDRPASLSWSRNPLRLGFTRTANFGSGQAEYLTAAPNGSDIRVEVAAGMLEGGSPSLAPDGASVVVVRSVPLPGLGSASRLELIDFGSGTRRFVTAAPDSTTRPFMQFPAWSPDGRSLAVVAHDQITGVVGLRVIDDRGVIQHERTVEQVASQPSWSPDGRSLAFCRYVPDPSRGRFFSRAEVALWSLRTGQERVITPTGAADCNPSWTR